jgi:hypothetical protein
MGMKDPDTRVLSQPALGVADLYVELASIRVHDAQAALVTYSSAAVLTQGAESLYEAIAHLREAAERFLRPAGPDASRLESLAGGLLAEAAAFEQSGDILVAGSSADTDADS